MYCETMTKRITLQEHYMNKNELWPMFETWGGGGGWRRLFEGWGYGGAE